MALFKKCIICLVVVVFSFQLTYPQLYPGRFNFGDELCLWKSPEGCNFLWVRNESGIASWVDCGEGIYGGGERRSTTWNESCPNTWFVVGFH